MEPERYGASKPRLWFFTYAMTLECPSATRQNSASQSLSRTTQFTWHLRASVSHRLVLVVVKFTCAVEPVGLKGSSNALTGYPFAWLLVMPAVMISHALSANSWYMS